MRVILLAAVAAIGFGLLSPTGAAALPAGGSAIGRSAADVQILQDVHWRWRWRHRHYRRCWRCW
jgi:hypothetical protein